MQFHKEALQDNWDSIVYCFIVLIAYLTYCGLVMPLYGAIE